MIDEEIRIWFNELHGKLDFKSLLTFMEDSGLDFKARQTRGPLGIATFYCIYIDIEQLKTHPDKLTYFVILHEMAHLKRIAKFGKKRLIEMLSLTDFEEFFDCIINEEIIADRYACYVYQKANKVAFPKYMTQRLDLESNRTRYESKARLMFGFVDNDEEKYVKMLESFII